MTKSELISKIQDELISEGKKKGYTKEKILHILDSFFNAIKKELANGEHIELRGFGTFETRVREEKNGINPRTKEKIVIPKHAVPLFRPGREFKEKVKNNYTID